MPLGPIVQADPDRRSACAVLAQVVEGKVVVLVGVDQDLVGAVVVPDLEALDPAEPAGRHLQDRPDDVRGRPCVAPGFGWTFCAAAAASGDSCDQAQCETKTHEARVAAMSFPFSARDKALFDGVV